MRKYTFLAAALLLSSCTIEPDGANVKKEFHMPFTTPEWEVRELTGANGQQACAVSAGYNGLAFVVRKGKSGNVVSVQSNRHMPKGTWLTVTVNGHRYETSNPYFSARDALAMAEDFQVAEKAYAEWSEIGSTSGRVRNGTVFELAGFKQSFKKCTG